MNVTDDQRTTIATIGEVILRSLEEISNWADAEQRTSTRSDVQVPLRALRDEPAITRVVVEWQEPSISRETFFICRGTSAGAPRFGDARLASYKGPLGRLAETPVGEDTYVVGPKGERKALIVEREQWRPLRTADTWDATSVEFAVQAWRLAVASLRSQLALEPAGPERDLLAEILNGAAEAENLLAEVRRSAIDRIALRDQPILDRMQGDVMRLPIDHRVVLLGPPGTGKTTTLIKRIAQKRTLEELPEEERDAVRAVGLSSALSASTGWAMFAPSDLLGEYLRAAFGKEGVAVGPDNLRTWTQERRRLARSVFSILRSESAGRFRLVDDAVRLVDAGSRALAHLHEAFTTFHEAQIASRFARALAGLNGSGQPEVPGFVAQLRTTVGTLDGVSPDHVLRLIQLPATFTDAIREIDRTARTWVDEQANRMLRLRPALIDDLLQLVQGAPTVDAEGDDDGDEASDVPAPAEVAPANPALQKKRAIDLLRDGIRAHARSLAEKRALDGRHKVLAEKLGVLLPDAAAAEAIGHRLRLRKALVELVTLPQRLLTDIPNHYASFRTQNLEYFASRPERDVVGPEEVDTMLLASFQAARRARAVVGWRDPPEWLARAESAYVPQIYVDEATDFSAVQLAILLEMAHPRLRSFFACGDFRQRITSSGIEAPGAFDWVSRAAGEVGDGAQAIEIREITIGHRQTKRLAEVAAALDPLRDPATPVVATAFPGEPAPLACEGYDRELVGLWLAERIAEIEANIGRVPAIAIFVDGDREIDPLVSAARPHLQERNLEIVGCKEGRVLGNAQEVRVFDVQYVKGLEFEAVFFIGIDDVARRAPDLFDRFIYVGCTRAASYLALHAYGSLPDRIAHVRGLLSTGDWKARA